MLKKIFYPIFFCISFLWYQSILAQSAVFILYHRFGESRYPSTNIRLDQFDAQLNYLKSHGFHVLPVPTIIDRLKHHEPLPDKTVGIMVDDAYDSVLYEAWPRLKKYGFPFTLFVATDPIDKNYSDMLTWKQIKILADAGVTIGNHTASHRHLNRISVKQALADIKKAQNRIVAETGQKPTLFAYPYGEYSLALKNAVKKLGFDAAFIQTSGAASSYSDFYALPRFGLNEHYGKMQRFRTIINALPLSIKGLEPADPILKVNPPLIRFTVINKQINLKKLACYSSDSQKLTVYILQGNQVVIKPQHAFHTKHTKINCTAPKSKGYFSWLGLFFYTDDNKIH